MTKEDIFNRAVSKLHAAQADENAVKRAELAALVQLGLGHPLDQRTFEDLVLHQTWLHHAQTDLSAKLEAGELTPGDYLKEFNKLTEFDADRSRAILGDERYQAIFGAADAASLTNQETFLSYRNSLPSPGSS